MPSPSTASHRRRLFHGGVDHPPPGPSAPPPPLEGGRGLAIVPDTVPGLSRIFWEFQVRPRSSGFISTLSMGNRPGELTGRVEHPPPVLTVSIRHPFPWEVEPPPPPGPPSTDCAKRPHRLEGPVIDSLLTSRGGNRSPSRGPRARIQRRAGAPSHTGRHGPATRRPQGIPHRCRRTVDGEENAPPRSPSTQRVRPR